MWDVKELTILYLVPLITRFTLTMWDVKRKNDEAVDKLIPVLP